MGKGQYEISDATLQTQVASAARTLTDVCYGLAYQAGWWKDPITSEPRMRPVPELIALIHSEISEGFEGWRKDKMDDHLPHRPMLEVEFADTLIRIFDAAGGLGLDVAGALAEKLAYNAKRKDHRLEERAKPGGKKV